MTGTSLLPLFSGAVREAARSGKRVSVTTHFDCDGLAAGGIMSRALAKAGVRFSVTAVKEFGADAMSAVAADGCDVRIILDLGGGFAQDIESKVGGEWFVLDHHQIPDSEKDNDRVINAWKLGIDGGTEACGATMAYIAAMEIDPGNAGLSAMAVVAALGDRQDVGPGRTLVGKNAEVARDAQEAGLLGARDGLLLSGRETRPLAEALAFTSRPFVEGLTWNTDACRQLLESAGVALKEGGRWRTASELGEGEQKAVTEAVAGHAAQGKADGVAGELAGCAYTLEREDQGSIVRDCREFGAALNSCGRSGQAGIGIAVCMGDRGAALAECRGALAGHRAKIKEYMDVLSGQRWRTSESDSCIMVNGEGLVPEVMTGTVSALIAGSPKSAGKVVVLRTAGEGGTVKFSSRKSMQYGGSVNLSAMMREGAMRFDGVGGGHDAAAGARITKDKLDDFLRYLEENVRVQGNDNPQ